MQPYGVNQLRKMFLEFFESKGHLAMKSFSLVPHNDKSLLLINSGMAPLKPYFTGQEIPPRRRVTTCQKCIRTGVTDGSTWIGCIPQVPCRDPDPDCDHCRICCCVALRNRRFLRSCCSTAFFTPEFFNTKVQMGGDRDHSSGTSGHCIGAYRTSDRNK